MLVMVLSLCIVCSSCAEETPKSMLTFQNAEKNVTLTLDLSKEEVEKRLSYVWEDEQELEQLQQYNGCGTVTYYPNDPRERFTVYYKNYTVKRISINNTTPELLSNWTVEDTLSIGSTEDAFIEKYGEPLSKNNGVSEDGSSYLIYYCSSDGSVLGKENNEASCTIIATFIKEKLASYMLVSTSL